MSKTRKRKAAPSNRCEPRARTYMTGKAGRRPLLEQAAPGALFLKVVDVCLQNPNLSERELSFFKSLVPLLADAVAEALAPVSQAEYPEAVNAVSWACYHAFDCPDGGRASGTLFLGSIFWLQSVLEFDYLVLAPGSAFDRAATMLIEDMGKFERDNPDVFARMERSARKLARGMQERFESLGLFVGATQPVQVAA